MLESLHVKNLALIDETEVLFTKGLNILTGETGAGKSIIVGSVNMALGAKADKEVIRSGAEYALIELLFTLNSHQEKAITDMELPLEEDGTLLIQRKILPTRSISKVNGETVTASQLRELASCLIDIHGQHDHQSLLKPARHMEILDDYAGIPMQQARGELKVSLSNFQTIKKELESKDGDEIYRKREMELIQFEVEEIAGAELIPGEDEEAERTYRRMVNAKRIKEGLYTAHDLTGYDTGEGAGENIGRALREIKNAAVYDDHMTELVEQLQDIDGLLNDFNRALSDYQETLDFDEQQFTETENRLNTLNHLKSKYGATLQEVLIYQQKKQERLQKLQDYEQYQQKLQEQLKAEKQKVLQACAVVSSLRQQAAKDLQEQLTAAMIDLNFLTVVFRIHVMPEEEHITAEGYDKVDFMISTNPGEELKPLQQVASGGELSRIMLAFKTVLADKDDINSLIFDEIDAGISGRTAWKVSEKLGTLGRNHQIICITHLPQIAAMADSHYVIQKDNAKDRTTTSIHRIQDEESIRELARLLGSEHITEAVLTNAREMKELAEKSKNIEMKN